MKRLQNQLQVYDVWHGTSHIYYGFLDYTAKQQLIKFYEKIKIIKIKRRK